MPDIVIDTNILVYLDNEDYKHHSCCVDCIGFVKDSNVSMCFDEGFHIDEAQNRSFVWHEIRKHCPHGSAGFAFVINLFEADRINILETSVPTKQRQIIDQSGIKKSDRRFVKLAFRSESKNLISDEHEDFTPGRRRHFRKEIGVKIIHSWETNQDMFQ